MMKSSIGTFRAIVRFLASGAAWSVGFGLLSLSQYDVLHAQVPRLTTKFQVDPFWPKPLPNDMILGPGSGVCVDPQDHVMIVQRTAEITKTNPEQAVEYGPTVV